MARPPGPGRCVHCLKERADRTWDHVFPKGWYPTTTPPNLAKWQIPSCRKCNAEYGKIEEDLLLRLAMALDPDEPKSAGIVAKAMRALNPDAAKSAKDRRRRLQKRQQLMRQAIPGAKLPDHGVYPGLDRRWGRQVNELTAIPFKAMHVRQLTEKIVRGIVFIEDDRFIEPPYHVHNYVMHDEGAAPVKDMLKRFGREYTREPGIVVHRAVTEEDGLSSFFGIEIWGQFKMYAAVDNCEEPTQ